MPDLTIESAWTCCTNTHWSREVQGSLGDKHIVRFERRPPSHEVQYDYTCTCLGFKFGRGKYCKHIEEVKGERCGWNAELDPTAEAVSGPPDNRPVCPNCGGDVEAFRVGV